VKRFSGSSAGAWAIPARRDSGGPELRISGPFPVPIDREDSDPGTRYGKSVLGYTKSLSENPAEHVMLSEAKHLKSFRANEILRFAQDDHQRFKRFSDRFY